MNTYITRENFIRLTKKVKKIKALNKKKKIELKLARQRIATLELILYG